MNQNSVEFFRIKNWEKYQSRDFLRGDGPMKWIRVQTDIFRDPKYCKMKPYQKLLWLQILLVAGQLRNRCPTDVRQLSYMMSYTRKPNIQFMWDMGLIEAYDAAKMPPYNTSTNTIQSPIPPLRVQESVNKEFADDEIKELWEKYPRDKLGSLSLPQAKTLIRFHIKNREDFEALKRAVANYSKIANQHDPKYARNLKRFFEDDFWKGYTREEKTALSASEKVFR